MTARDDYENVGNVSIRLMRMYAEIDSLRFDNELLLVKVGQAYTVGYRNGLNDRGCP